MKFIKRTLKWLQSKFSPEVKLLKDFDYETYYKNKEKVLDELENILKNIGDVDALNVSMLPDVIFKDEILTDFNNERWLGYDKEELKEQINEIIAKCDMLGCIYGEIGNPESLDTTLCDVSHAIKNIRFEDNRVFGDVRILKTKKGKEALKRINEFGFKMNIRAVGTHDKNIKKIFTWDII